MAEHRTVRELSYGAGQLCCGVLHGFLAAAARRSHAARSAAQDGGLVATKGSLESQFRPSTSSHRLGSLSAASHPTSSDCCLRSAKHHGDTDCALLPPTRDSREEQPPLLHPLLLRASLRASLKELSPPCTDCV